MRVVPVSRRGSGKLVLAVLAGTALAFPVVTSFAPAQAKTPTDTVVRQAGGSAVYQVAIPATATHQWSGTLMVNLDRHTFVFNGKGFSPNAPYTLENASGRGGGWGVLASGAATPAGTLHVAGTWIGDESTLLGVGMDVIGVEEGYVGNLSHPSGWAGTMYEFTYVAGAPPKITYLVVYNPPAGLVPSGTSYVDATLECPTAPDPAHPVVDGCTLTVKSGPYSGSQYPVSAQLF